MLVATPLLHMNNKVLAEDEPPRIISAVRKAQIGVCREQQSRPRLSADLFVRFGSEQQWWPRKVSIRGGQLMVSSIHVDARYGSVRIPLRRLSLSAGKLANSLSLIRGQNILLSIQTPTERAFDIWVKAIAIELIRQTPLEDVKYFDILNIEDDWKHEAPPIVRTRRDQNFNRVQPTAHCESCSAISPRPSESAKRSTPMYATILKYGDSDIPREVARYRIRTYTSQRSLQAGQRNVEKIPLRTRSRSCNSVSKGEEIDKPRTAPPPPAFDSPKGTIDRDEKAIEILLKKCQNHENYVPVKEKLLLFETLCRLGRKVRSTEDVHLKTDMGSKRARSLHDLHSISNAGVRRICRYFEDKCESTGEKAKDKRLINSDSNLNTIRAQGWLSAGYA